MIKLDTSRWRRKFDRVGQAVRRMPAIELGAPGQEKKVAAAERRGDSLDFSDSGMAIAHALLAEGIADLANSGGTSLRETAHQIGAHLAEDLASQILDGAVDGPDRSEEWNREKGHDTKLLGKTGELAGAIRHRLVSR